MDVPSVQTPSMLNRAFPVPSTEFSWHGQREGLQRQKRQKLHDNLMRIKDKMLVAGHHKDAVVILEAKTWKN